MCVKIQKNGGDPDRETMAVLRRRMAALILRFGGARFAKAALSCLGAAHKLKGPYLYIVTKRFDDLAQRLWQPPVSALGGNLRRSGRRLSGGRYARLSETKKRRTR